MCVCIAQLPEESTPKQACFLAQDKSLSLERKLAEKERECHRLATQQRDDEVTAAPSDEGLRVLRLEFQQRVVALEALVDEHELRKAEGGKLSFL